MKILENENARDIFVCRVPKDVKYVDYMVICSSNNYRTMSALAEVVRTTFKEKNSDKIIGLPMIEGGKSRDWMALDLGSYLLLLINYHVINNLLLTPSRQHCSTHNVTPCTRIL